jgi:CRISP-associated protein Cas1
VEKGAVIYAKDPILGITHFEGDDWPAFVFDMIEPERPKIDRAVLDFVKGQVFDPAVFVIRSDGVCGLTRKWRERW